MVDPRGAEMELRPSVDEEYSPATGDAFTRHFLVRRGLSSTAPATLQEYCIRPGDHLFVLATLRENPGLESAADCLAGDAAQGHQGFLSAAAADLQRRAAIESMLPPGSAVPPMPRATPVETEVIRSQSPGRADEGDIGCAILHFLAQPARCSCRVGGAVCSLHLGRPGACPGRRVAAGQTPALKNPMEDGRLARPAGRGRPASINSLRANALTPRLANA